MQSFLRGKSAFFVPTIEVVKDANAFLTEEPLDLFKTGRFHRVPILTGLTANEGLLISPSSSIIQI
jgi:carboxylesterase type B